METSSIKSVEEIEKKNEESRDQVQQISDRLQRKQTIKKNHKFFYVSLSANFLRVSQQPNEI